MERLCVPTLSLVDLARRTGGWAARALAACNFGGRKEEEEEEGRKGGRRKALAAAAVSLPGGAMALLLRACCACFHCAAHACHHWRCALRTCAARFIAGAPRWRRALPALCGLDDDGQTQRSRALRCLALAALTSGMRRGVEGIHSLHLPRAFRHAVPSRILRLLARRFQISQKAMPITAYH